MSLYVGKLVNNSSFNITLTSPIGVNDASFDFTVDSGKTWDEQNVLIPWESDNNPATILVGGGGFDHTVDLYDNNYKLHILAGRQLDLSPQQILNICSAESNSESNGTSFCITVSDSELTVENATVWNVSFDITKI